MTLWLVTKPEWLRGSVHRWVPVLQRDPGARRAGEGGSPGGLLATGPAPSPACPSLGVWGWVPTSEARLEQKGKPPDGSLRPKRS